MNSLHFIPVWVTAGLYISIIYKIYTFPIVYLGVVGCSLMKVFSLLSPNAVFTLPTVCVSSSSMSLPKTEEGAGVTAPAFSRSLITRPLGVVLCEKKNVETINKSFSMVHISHSLYMLDKD